MKISYKQTGKYINIVIWSTILSCISVLAQEPEGQLYWMTDNEPASAYGVDIFSPQDTVTLYNPGVTWGGAWNSIEQGCIKLDEKRNDIRYQNSLVLHSDPLDTYIVSAACNIKQRNGFGIWVPIQSVVFTAYTYCNGVQSDVLPPPLCEPPDQLVDENNFGVSCEEVEE